MTQNQISGLLGAALLFAGLFSPIFTSPVIGQLDYFQYDKVEASIVLFLAALSLALALARVYQALLFTGLGACATLGFSFFKFQLYTSGQGGRWTSTFSDSPFEGINRLTMNSFSLDWGWGLLLVGAVLVVAAANMKGYRKIDD